jgi:hypothetical protein
MKIGITGRNSFIGQLLIKKYMELRDEVKILSRNTRHKIESANLCVGALSIIEYLWFSIEFFVGAISKYLLIRLLIFRISLYPILFITKATFFTKESINSK